MRFYGTQACLGSLSIEKKLGKNDTNKCERGAYNLESSHINYNNLMLKKECKYITFSFVGVNVIFLHSICF